LSYNVFEKHVQNESKGTAELFGVLWGSFIQVVRSIVCLGKSVLYSKL
jgi:hypothetical protein